MVHDREPGKGSKRRCSLELDQLTDFLSLGLVCLSCSDVNPLNPCDEKFVSTRRQIYLQNYSERYI
jgi:hypothetical protein